MSLIDDKWELLFDRYEIAKKVSESCLFSITADQIREYKEPRLMTKFDTRESLPRVFGKNLGILPVTRGSYVIGNFDLYEDFPEQFSGENGKESAVQIRRVSLPDWYETIDGSEIRSEAAAINVMGLTGMLDDFLGEKNFRQTVSGRMASGKFSFFVRSRSGGSSSHEAKGMTGGSGMHGVNGIAGGSGIHGVKSTACCRIQVNNSQVEIDGGFESRESFAVLEGKNVVHSNFLVRQLYYPYRLWEAKLKKQVRPVFLVYSNNIFRLLEYEFTDRECYHSIRLVKEGLYSLEDTEITEAALYEVWKQTKVKPEPEVTFIQADSFEKVISLTEHLKEQPLSAAEIAERFGFRERQSDYYYNACKYLGLAEKRKDADGIVRVALTDAGYGLLKLRYQPRQLEYVKLILEHRIFHELFEEMLRTGAVPEKRRICARMSELRLCGPSLIERRASSVAGWLRWMRGLYAK